MLGFILAAAFIVPLPVVESAPETLNPQYAACGTVMGTPEFVLVHSDNLGRYAAATKYAGELADHISALMQPCDAVYIITDSLGNESAGILHNGRLDGAWVCKCVGTGGISGFCPGLPNCPPKDCSNDSVGAHANCTSVKVFNP